MTNYPPPHPADGERPLTEPTAKPLGVPTSASAPRKKPWSKPTVLVVEDGVLLTKSGRWTDPNTPIENEDYTLTS